MHSTEFPGATNAPDPRALKTARVIAAGETRELAAELVALWFPASERGDLALLHELTLSRCAAASMGARS